MCDIEDTVKPFWLKNLSEEHIQKCLNFIDRYYFGNENLSEIKDEFNIYQRTNNFGDLLKYGSLITIYKIGRLRGHYPNANTELEERLKIKNVRESSGVMVFSIFTSPYPQYTIKNNESIQTIKNFTNETKNIGQFTCKYDCSFCPKDPDMPKSYIASEPGVSRALMNNFDPVKQIFDRGLQYIQQGHPIDKIEVIIQGGTWDSYSIEYREEFIRDIYWTFNIFMDWLFYDKTNELFDSYEVIDGKKLRQKQSLEEEIKINETSPCRVIGLTPETRPDQINYQTIKFLRQIGATRVQLGIQHINDDILKYNNRGCYNKHTIRAIKMLKDNGFKVDAHFMLDMPHPEKYSQEQMIQLDKYMLEQINTNPDYKVDQIKIYPCVVTPHTTIKQWYDSGKYIPYGETIRFDGKIWKKMTKQEKLNHRLANPLYNNILTFYSSIHPSIRVNRIIRDIPTNEICGGTTQNGMRSEIDRDMEYLNLTSNDIRYREAGSYKFNNKIDYNKEPIYNLVKFESSGATEYFLSFESDKPENILFSFLRLRLSTNSGKTHTGKIIFPELVNCALIRELHTYGKIQPCKENYKYYKNNPLLFEEFTNNKSQHKGLGKKLLKKAEEIALNNGYNKIAVIAGVGVREYYRNNGYTLDSTDGCYQIKILDNNNNNNNKLYVNTFLFGIIAPFTIKMLFGNLN